MISEEKAGVLGFEKTMIKPTGLGKFFGLEAKQGFTVSLYNTDGLLIGLGSVKDGKNKLGSVFEQAANADNADSVFSKTEFKDFSGDPVDQSVSKDFLPVKYRTHVNNGMFSGDSPHYKVDIDGVAAKVRVEGLWFICV